MRKDFDWKGLMISLDCQWLQFPFRNFNWIELDLIKAYFEYLRPIVTGKLV